MVNIDSELFRRHPEYASLVPGREPMVHRFQYSLDLSDNEVAEYVYASVCRVIELCSADYVKWDFNRIMTEFYSPKLKNQGEYDYRYMCNLYSVLQRLIEKFPDVLFESCAGGGGRFDLGLLCLCRRFGQAIIRTQGCACLYSRGRCAGTRRIPLPHTFPIVRTILQKIPHRWKTDSMWPQSVVSVMSSIFPH